MSDVHYWNEDELLAVMPEGGLIDDYFARGAFVVEAPLGQRGRIRDEIKRLAATHDPPLKVFVNDGSHIQGIRGRLYVEVAG